ncbi:MAG: aspartyl/asparaginyl beta-hydroxylase domain-containing protein [Gammaproteobacteria bacterium]|nr:aspartyl/asparaginyl beta-hydroxylase domain-containing protein [Gammaproteobacteria bacterium]
MNQPAAAQLQSVLQQARDATRARRFGDAALAWRRLLEIDANNVEALLGLAQQALAAGNAQVALGYLERAAVAAPRDAMVQLYRALAFKNAGDQAQERAALLRSLEIDPYFYPALLHLGMLCERQGKRRQAAKVFRDVLKIMPLQDQQSPAFRDAVAHARLAIEQDQAELERHLQSAVASLRDKHAGERLQRFDESLQVLVGNRKRYAPEPAMFHFAQLPPLQFYDESLFPWMAALESQTEAIKAELLNVLAESREEFRPYIQYPAGAPVNQWAELNRSPKWSSYFLWKDGKRIEEHCAKCPRTAAALAAVPLASTPNLSPTAMFSVLEPRTVIPPHTGETNARLIVHLPLIIPPACSFRVGNETRSWQVGKAFAFDDSVEHEARNDSDELRAVLIFDVWNPYLTPAEREFVSAALNGLSGYYQD